MSPATADQGASGGPDGDGRHRGQAAVLGVRVLRNSGVQGLSMAVASLLQLVNLFIVAHFLGPADLGRFALLFFGANLLAQLLSIAVKPGTIRRTFGAGDDEDDDDEDEEDTSTSPKRSLGTGLVLAGILATGGALLAIALRVPIAELLLGSSDDANLVVWAALFGSATVLSRLTAIVIWFERRPVPYLVCELSRPTLTLAVITVLLASGAGLEAVLIAGTAGSLAAALIGLVFLRHSFEPALARSELVPILQRGRIRGPIMMSFWTVSSADVFLLSRFVTDSELGVYTLASRVGFMAAFLPQGFRVAMRPLRKAAIFKAVEEQYGRAEQRGQLLGYFMLLCIAAVLAMVLIAPLVVEIAPSDFADAAPLIPLAAAGMVGPALLRTVNQQTTWPGRTNKTFIASAVLFAALFVAVTLLLGPAIGKYAAPVGMLAGMILPAAYLFIRCQRGPDRIRFPYREVGTAAGLGVLIGGGYALLPDIPVVLEALIALGLGAAYLGLLIRLRVVPESHWEALAHMTRSVVSGRADHFNPRRGLRALKQDERDELRAAVSASWAGRGSAKRDERNQGPAAGPPRGEHLVQLLRRTAERGGASVGESSELDDGVGAYLFSVQPTAVRNADMRRLLDEGAEAGDLRALEDMVAHLAAVPSDAWMGGRKGAREGRSAK